MDTSSTKTGMSNYKFRRPEMTLDDVITPEIRAKNMKMLEEAKDAKIQALTEKAYEAASKNAMKHGGKVKKMAEGGMYDETKDKAMIKKAFKQHDSQEHKGDKGTTLKLAKGGSASKRADGICSKGKTKGRFV